MSKDIVIGVHGQAQTIEGINGIQVIDATGNSKSYAPESSMQVGGKTIIENGTYDAADDDMLGYRRVVVMDLVSEGPTEAAKGEDTGAMIACGGLGRSFPVAGKISVTDTDGKAYVVAPVPDLKTSTLSVSHPGVYDAADDGLDAYTSVNVSVSDSERDAAGFNPSNPTWQDNLPDEIRVTTPPTKMDYYDGEEIDYTGMVVTAYKNGSVWSNAKYPNGVIPHEELILSDEKAGEQIPFVTLEDMKSWFDARYKGQYAEWKTEDYPILFGQQLFIQNNIALSYKYISNFSGVTYQGRLAYGRYVADISINISSSTYPMLAIYLGDYESSGSSTINPYIFTPADYVSISVSAASVYELYESDKSTLIEIIEQEPYANNTVINNGAGNPNVELRTYDNRDVYSLEKMISIPDLYKGGSYSFYENTSNNIINNSSALSANYRGYVGIITPHYEWGISQWLSWLIRYSEYGNAVKIAWKRPVDNVMLTTYLDINIID